MRSYSASCAGCLRPWAVYVASPELRAAKPCPFCGDARTVYTLVSPLLLKPRVASPVEVVGPPERPPQLSGRRARAHGVGRLLPQWSLPQ